MVSHAVKPTPIASTEEESLPSLAEVLDRVASDGPQIITRGGERFVVVGAQDFVAAPKRPSLVDALLSGPRFDGVEIEREPWDMREVDL